MALSLNELIDQLSGMHEDDAQTIDIEIESTEKRLGLLRKLRDMVPGRSEKEPQPMVPQKPGKMKFTKARREADKLPRKTDDATDLEGNLLTAEERRLATCKLLSEKGPLGPGAIASYLKCDTSKIYSMVNYDKQGIGLADRLFISTQDGYALSQAGRDLVNSSK